MPTYRFDLNEEYGKRLEKDAEDSMMTVQDYIRSRLFPSENIFTVLELVKRIKAKGPFEEFTIPDLTLMKNGPGSVEQPQAFWVRIFTNLPVHTLILASH